MSNKYKSRSEVFAAVRIDEFLNGTAPLIERITVKEIVSSAEIADAEVKRLNALNSPKDCIYFWQMSRLFPEGTSAGTELAAGK